jgi:hypothetical protein
VNCGREHSAWRIEEETWHVGGLEDWKVGRLG